MSGYPDCKFYAIEHLTKMASSGEITHQKAIAGISAIIWAGPKNGDVCKIMCDPEIGETNSFNAEYIWYLREADKAMKKVV